MVYESAVDITNKFSTALNNQRLEVSPADGYGDCLVPRVPHIAVLQDKRVGLGRNNHNETSP